MSIRTGPLGHGQHPHQQHPKPSTAFSRNAYIALTFFIMGWLSWAAFVYVGVRVRHRKWIVAGAIYFAITTVWTLLLGLGEGEAEEVFTSIGAILCFSMWAASIVHAFVIRKEFGRRLDLRLRVEDGQLDREIARDLVQTDPQLARELGIGRPDLVEASPGGVVDVNHASAGMLAMLPGIDPRIARQIVGTREAMGPFSSVAELGMVLDLPPDTVEALRPLVVFLK